MKLIIAVISLVSLMSYPAPANDGLPAHIASPEQYSVLLDNDSVLVLKMDLDAGESDEWHFHRAETVYFEKGGELKITTSTGEMKLTVPDGHVMWHEPWQHQVSNIGNTQITAIIVEQKTHE